MEAFTRSELLFGIQGMEKLAKAHVAVFGVGGVGGHAAEALCRGGIGALTLFDNDVVSISNINRQIVATTKTVGQSKAKALADRLLEINPALQVIPMQVFYTPENADEYPLEQYDYILDAIDTVSAKMELIVRADKAGVPLMSAMGCGNKLDPTRFVVTDLYKTDTDPLARVLRHELRRRGVTKLKVVYSTEPAIKTPQGAECKASGRPVPGSTSFVPGVAGMIMAGEIIRELAQQKEMS